MERLPYFHTNRLVLRPWEMSDADRLFALASNPSIGPSAGWAPHKSVEESLEIIRSVFTEQCTWAITLKGTGEVIGSVGYSANADSNIEIGPQDGEVGYWVGEEYWNKGYATEALKAVAKYAFTKGKIRNLWGCFFADNVRSGKVMSNCGFTGVGEPIICPNLRVGGDLPVRKMFLSRRAWIRFLFS